jgi:hypothetical protein
LRIKLLADASEAAGKLSIFAGKDQLKHQILRHIHVFQTRMLDYYTIKNKGNKN